MPVTPAFMFPEPEMLMLAPPPIIRVNVQPELGLVFNGLYRRWWPAPLNRYQAE
jgi:hypothetical protein